MTKIRDIFHCTLCGDTVEVVFPGQIPVCCGKQMELLTPKSGEEGKEKHHPVTETTAGGLLVKVGSIDHPMLENHYIAFIEVTTENMVLRAELKPGEKPQALFTVNEKDVTGVRAYCNVHGLWK